MIHLKTTLRGARLVCSEPDVRYRRYHTDVCPAPAEVAIGRAIKVHVPARPSCSAYDEWRIEGRRVDPGVYFLLPVLRDGSDEHVRGTGRWDLLGDPIPAGDPELLALRAELDDLDRAWLAENQAEIVAENLRTERVIESTEQRIEWLKDAGVVIDDPDDGLS